MTRTITIRDWLPEPLANVSGDNWRLREKKLKAASIMVWTSAKQEGLEPVEGRALVNIILVFPSKRRRDADNLYARVKGVLDGLVKGGWIQDDSTDTINLLVGWRIGQKATVITVEPL